MKKILALVLLGSVIFASCTRVDKHCKRDDKRIKKSGAGWKY